MADLARTLAELGDHIELPDGGDPAAAGLARIRADRDRRPLLPENGTNERRTWALVAAALVVAVVAVAALPGPRDAVARLLGVGGVTITRGEVGDLPATPDLGDPLAVDDALARLASATLPDAGPPAQAFTGRPPRAVSLVWAATDDLPAVAGSDAGLVLTVFPSSPELPLVGKVAGPGTGVSAVSVDGHPGYWVDGGPHEVVFETPDGAATSARLAGNTLVWSDGRRTYRLESALDRSGALGLVSDDR